jgi:tol-pal system protein YbgF
MRLASRFSPFGLAVVVLAFAALPASAASKDVERLQIQLSTLQSQINDLQRVIVDNARDVKRLSDMLGEQNATLKKTQQDQKIDHEAIQVALKEIQERLAQIAERAPAAPALPPPGTGGGGTLPAIPGTSSGETAPLAPVAGGGAPLPGELFSQAYADYTRGQYDLAIQEFREYLKRFPTGERADSSQYWIGVSLAGKQKYQEAVDAFDALLQNFPSSDKIPDTHVKKGGALEKLGKRREALMQYRYVVDHFPNSAAAKIARDKLGS